MAWKQDKRSKKSKRRERREKKREEREIEIPKGSYFDRMMRTFR